MILGLLLLVFGNILIWGSDEETTQFFSGWVIGVLSICVAPSLPRVPRLALASVACVFIIANEQTLTSPPSKINCVNGEERILGESINAYARRHMLEMHVHTVPEAPSLNLVSMGQMPYVTPVDTNTCTPTVTTCYLATRTRPCATIDGCLRV